MHCIIMYVYMYMYIYIHIYICFEDLWSSTVDDVGLPSM